MKGAAAVEERQRIADKHSREPKRASHKRKGFTFQQTTIIKNAASDMEPPNQAHWRTVPALKRFSEI